MIICGLRKNIKKTYRNICRTRKIKNNNRKNRKKVKQMKKKNKIYELIGRATTKILAFLLIETSLYYTLIYILDNCITVYK